MDNEQLQQQMRNLVQAVSDLERASKEALGFTSAIQYRGISFDVSRRFVIADLSPLAFFHLVEQISDEGIEKAILRLYDRLMPLLTCEHKWTTLKRVSDAHLRTLSQHFESSPFDPHVCRACTAYALSTPGYSLPSVGRMQ